MESARRDFSPGTECGAGNKTIGHGRIKCRRCEVALSTWRSLRVDPARRKRNSLDGEGWRIGNKTGRLEWTRAAGRAVACCRRLLRLTCDRGWKGIFRGRAGDRHDCRKPA